MTKGSVLPAADIKNLTAFVRRVGEVAAIKAIGCSPQTLARAMAGFPIYKSTARCLTNLPKIGGAE